EEKNERGRDPSQENRHERGRAEPDTRNEQKRVAGRVFAGENRCHKSLELLEELRKRTSRRRPTARSEDASLQEVGVLVRNQGEWIPRSPHPSDFDRREKAERDRSPPRGKEPAHPCQFIGRGCRPYKR